MEADEEKRLWLSCVKGNMDAREQLIIAYRPLVFWIASKIHVTDTILKQDIIQEGMLALIRAVDGFEPERELKFSTYAYHKIHGAIINMIQRSENKAPLPVPDEWLQIDPEPDDSQDWYDVASSISHLQGREAEVVSALFFEGKKPKEVAEEKRMDISHVYRLRRTAITKIRALLGLEGAM